MTARNLLKRVAPYVATIALAVLLTGCMRFLPMRKSLSYIPPKLDTIQRPVVDIEAIAQKHKGAPGVTLGRRTTAVEEAWLPNTNSYSTIRAHRYIVLDPTSDNVANIDEDFSTDIRVDAADVLIFNPDGTSTQYTLKDFTITKRGENWISYSLPLKNIVRGSIVDHAWVLSAAHGLAFSSVEPTSMRTRLPSERSEFSYQYPKGYTLNIRKLPTDSPVKRINLTAERKVIFVVEDQPGVRNEPFSPSNASRFLQIAHGVQPPSRFTSGSYWRDLQKATYNRIFASESDEKFSDKDFLDTCSQIVQSAKSRVDSVQAIKSWISRNIKIDYDASATYSWKVFRRRVGSVDGVALLARQMYMALGFTPRLVLLHSRGQGDFDPLYHHWGQFGELSLVVEKGTEKYLVLLQRPLQPVNVVPSDYIQQPYLFVDTEDGESIFESPVYVMDTSSVHRRIRVKLDESGSATVSVESVRKGNAAYEHRIELEDVIDSERERHLRNKLVTLKDEVEDVKVSVEGLDNPIVPLVYKSSYVLPSGVTVTPTEAIFQVAGVLMSATESSETDTSARMFPISVWAPWRYGREIEIEYPSHWRLRTTLSEDSRTSTLGSASRIVNNTPGKLVISTSGSLIPGTYDPSLAGDLEAIDGDNTYAIPNLIFSTN